MQLKLITKVLAAVFVITTTATAEAHKPFYPSCTKGDAPYINELDKKQILSILKDEKLNEHNITSSYKLYPYFDRSRPLFLVKIDNNLDHTGIRALTHEGFTYIVLGADFSGNFMMGYYAPWAWSNDLRAALFFRRQGHNDFVIAEIKRYGFLDRYFNNPSYQVKTYYDASISDHISDPILLNVNTIRSCLGE